MSTHSTAANADGSWNAARPSESLEAVRLQRASTVEDFLYAPIGRFVKGATFLVWCHDPTLCGAIYWDVPSEEDTRALLPLYEIDRHPCMSRPFDVLTDARYVRGVDPAAFWVLINYLRRRLPEYARNLRRHAVVHPEGAVGSTVAGLYSLLRPKYAWSLFAQLDDAVAWLGHPQGAQIGACVSDLADQCGVSDVVARLRLRLASGQPMPGSLSEVAKTLGVSARTLQRALHTAQSSYRLELSRARAERARVLLSVTEEKLDAFGPRVGLASRSQLSAALRRATGRRPSRFRPRRRRQES